MPTAATAWITRSPAHRPVLRARSFLERRRVNAAPPQPIRTRYCISPYKTGCGYLTHLFRSHDQQAAHAPLHHTSLLHLDDPDFLARRAALLKLRLECSGFLAGRLALVRSYAPRVPVLYLRRSPATWMGSLIHHLAGLERSMHYNFVGRLVFEPLCGGPVENFFRLDGAMQARIVRALVAYWIRVYSEPQNDEHALTVPLRNLHERLEEVEDFLGMQAARSSRPWSRSGRSKHAISLRDYADLDDLSPAVERLGETL